MRTMHPSRVGCLVILASLAVAARQAAAVTYTSSFTSGGSWNTVYGRGFSTSLTPAPDPGLSTGVPVYLNQFDFYKSGNADTASNVRLAILNNFYANLQGLTTASPAVAGLSTNTVAGTGSIATGAPTSFQFNGLPLSYGGDYGAVFVNVGPNGELTPVLVSALTANYAQAADSNFHPTANYGSESQFQYTTSNFISTNQFGQFFNAFSYAGDANFTATLSTVPEPAAVTTMVGTVLAVRRRRRVAR
jgi:hypothetical protein